MLRVSSKGKHIEWDSGVQQKNQQQQQQQVPVSPDPTMRKTRSVDFSRMTIRTSIGHNNSNFTHTTSAIAAASQFSRRAARGSFKGLNDELIEYYSKINDDESDSDCHQWNKRSSLMPNRDSKDRRHDLSAQEAIDTMNQEKSSFYHRLLQSIASVLPRISLVKLSVCLLACATLFDMALTNMHNTTDRPTRVSLGSAAISSVTDTLSPILPFAGGLDLRRGDYWLVSDDSTWLKTLQSVFTQVQDAFAAKEEASHASKKKSAKMTSAVKEAAPRTKKNSKSSRSSSYEMSISASQPFVSLDTIAQLTLGDIGECFRYAMESSNIDYSESRFYSQSSSSGSALTQPYLRQVLVGMQDAVDRSRGKRVVDWRRLTDGTTTSSNGSTVDALKFSAAMRVFAEWRLLRQVPIGYKGFAIGMSLGHKDVVQNIIKIEESVHDYVDYQHDVCAEQHDVVSESCKQLQTPTLNELLSFEIETGVHPVQRLPYLKEKSAGMGLLWVRRQLAYQTQIFDNVLHMKDGESMKNAVGAAYTQVYDRYHGWAVQKIFNYSFQAAPEAEEILRHMNPTRLQELLAEQRSQNQKRSSSSSTGDNVNGSKNEKDINVIDQVIDHVGGEWDKLAYNVVKVFNRDAEPPQSMTKLQHQGLGTLDSFSPSCVDEVHVTNEMVKDAHVQIQMYLQRIQPILQSTIILFQDLNMEDPTRV